MRTLSLREIKDSLRESNRWGVNHQPPLEEVAEVLAHIGVVEVRASGPVLEFITAKPLTPSQAYILARLGQDEPDCIDDTQVEFHLWWD